MFLHSGDTLVQVDIETRSDRRASFPFPGICKIYGTASRGAEYPMARLSESPGLYYGGFILGEAR
jgi:hypothetical protein